MWLSCRIKYGELELVANEWFGIRTVQISMRYEQKNKLLSWRTQEHGLHSYVILYFYLFILFFDEITFRSKEN